MFDKKIGIVLEGGGLRGVYTAGALDFFMDKNYYMPYVIGVSAGACQAYSYLSKQKGRSFKVSHDYIGDPRYLSLRSFISKGEIFGMDFMFDEIPNRLLPFDFHEFDNSAQEFVIGATNCETGKAEYFSNKEGHDMFLIGRASSSLPVVSKVVEVYGKPYLDGGMSDPIPIRQAQSDGYENNIVILTRDEAYFKKESKYTVSFLKKIYKKYPQVAKTYALRAKVYNESLEYIKNLEAKGKVFIIRPGEKVSVGRMEKNIQKLKEFYESGYNEAGILFPKLENWMTSK